MRRAPLPVALLLLLLCLSGAAATERDTLVFGTSSEPISLDPPNQWDGASARVINNLYENLVTYDPDSFEIIPALARTWEISLDRTVWTFTLRPGVRFHDGTPLTAEAVKFNFERQMDPESPHAHGRCECFRANFSILDTVETEGDDRVRFRLKRPYVPFIEQLAMAPMAIASPDAIRRHGAEFGRNPVGTGPFVFEEWVAGDHVSVVRNPDYWGDKARLARIIFRTIPDNRARRIKLSSGTIDAMDRVNPDEVEVLERNPRIKVLRCQGLNIGYVAMNTRKPPFDRVKVRRALNHAINKKAIIDYLYQGLGVPARTPIPPAMWGANGDVVDHDYNPALARRLLAEAGFPRGFETTLHVLPVAVDAFPNPDETADALVANLREAGVRARKVSHDWRTYQEKLLHGEHEMAMLGWTADIPDPDNFLYTLLATDNTTPGLAENIAFFSDPALDDLLRQAQTTYERATRIDLYRRAQVIVRDQAPWIPIAHTTVVLACRADVEGLRALPISIDNYAAVRIAGRGAR